MSNPLYRGEPDGFYHPAPAAYLTDSGAMGEPAPDPASSGAARLLNAATAPFPVNLSLNNVPQVAGSVFSSLTSYAPVPEGGHVVTVTKEDGNNTVLLKKPIHFDAGSRSTVILTDSAAGGMGLISFPDPLCGPGDDGQSFIRTANVSMEGSSFGLSMEDGTVLYASIPFGCATAYQALSPGPYSFYVSEDSGLRWSGGTLATASLDIKPRAAYTLYILGNTWSPYGFRLVPVQDA